MLGDRGSEYVIRALNKLKQHGVRIALDDFGTGFSSLTHIRDYPIDCLKLIVALYKRCNMIHPFMQLFRQLAYLLQISHSD